MSLPGRGEIRERQPAHQRKSGPAGHTIPPLRLCAAPSKQGETARRYMCHTGRSACDRRKGLAQIRGVRWRQQRRRRSQIGSTGCVRVNLSNGGQAGGDETDISSPPVRGSEIQLTQLVLLSTPGTALRGDKKMSKKSSADDGDTVRANWIEVIDGWVRDPKIRRDALFGLALVMLTLGGAGAYASGALAPLLHNTAAQILAGGASVLGTGWAGARYVRRQRSTRRAATSAALAADLSTAETAP